MSEYECDFPIAVIEAKRKYCKTADEGLEQARNYAQILGVKFAYSTNGVAVVEERAIRGGFPHVSRRQSLRVQLTNPFIEDVPVPRRGSRRVG